MLEVNEKNLGYNLRYGYTDGFNAGLTDSENEFSLPEEKWKSVEKLDPGEFLRQPNVNDALPEYEYAGDRKEYYCVGYNWGYLHGGQVREDLKQVVTEGIFEKSMGEFANALEISYLQVGKERYLYGITSLDPVEERGYRLDFINEFLKIPGKENEESTNLETIRELITGNRIQLAIEDSVIYFRTQRNLSAYSQARTFQSRLMKIRRASQDEEISKEEYGEEKDRILRELSLLIDKEI